MASTRIRLLVLLGILAAIGGGYFYSRMPVRFDGSSLEAFQESRDQIFDSLESHERSKFRKDLKDLGFELTMEDPKLFRRAFAAGFGKGDKNAIDQEIQSKLAKKLNGKTLDEFRVMAEESRGKKKKMIDRALNPTPAESRDFAERQKQRWKNPPKPIIELMWESEEELLQAAPQVELVTKELEIRDTKLLIDLPKEATIERSKIKFSNDIVAQINTSICDVRQLKRINGLRDYEGLDTIVFANDTIYMEKLHAEKECQSHPYETRMDITLSEYRHLGAQVEWKPEEYVSESSTKLKPALLFVRCLKTLRLKEPDPTEPLALLMALGAKFQPADVKDARSVTGIEFSEDAVAAELRVLKHFPNLESIVIPGLTPLNVSGEASPLKACRNLRKIVYASSLREEDLKAVLGHAGLEELDVDMSSTWSDPTWFDLFTKLKNLRKLAISVDPDRIELLEPIASCSMLEELKLEVFSTEECPGTIDFVTRLPKLRVLSLEGFFSGAAIDSPSEIDGLKSLSIERRKLSKEDLARLARCKSLETLSLDYREAQFAPGDFVVLTGIPLKHLRVTCGYGADGASIQDAHLTEFAKTNASLEVLEIGSESVTVEGLRSILSLPRLKRIAVLSPTDIERDDIKKLNDENPNIEIKREYGW